MSDKSEAVKGFNQGAQWAKEDASRERRSPYRANRAQQDADWLMEVADLISIDEYARAWDMFCLLPKSTCDWPDNGVEELIRLAGK